MTNYVPSWPALTVDDAITILAGVVMALALTVIASAAVWSIWRVMA